jgi:hypothetical protein
MFHRPVVFRVARRDERVEKWGLNALRVWVRLIGPMSTELQEVIMYELQSRWN